MDAGLIFVAYELGWEFLDQERVDAYTNRFDYFMDVHPEEDPPEIRVIRSRQEEVEWGANDIRRIRRLHKYFIGIGIEMFWEDSVQIDSPGMIERISLARDILIQSLGNEFEGEPGIYVKGPI